MALTDFLGEEFWARHTNPWSGYTRLPMGPVLLAVFNRLKESESPVLRPS